MTLTVFPQSSWLNNAGCHSTHKIKDYVREEILLGQLLNKGEHCSLFLKPLNITFLFQCTACYDCPVLVKKNISSL